MRVAVLLALLVSLLVASVDSQVRVPVRGLRIGTAGAPEGPGDEPGLFVPGGADAATLQTRYSSGAGLTRFQAALDIFCRTNANGGQLDTYATRFSGSEHLGIYWYAYLEYSYPVPNANYRDCTNQAAIDTPLLGLIDTILGGTCCQTFAPSHTAFCFALQLAPDRLGSTRIQNMINWLQTNTDTWAGVNPVGHQEGSRGRLVYVMSGYCFKGLLGGAEDAGAEGADARIAKLSTYVQSATGNQTHLSLSGLNGGYLEGWDYWASELLQSIGYVDLYFHDAYASYTGTASTVWGTGNNPIHEYYPQWIVHNLAPYKLVPSPTFPTYLLLKGPMTQDRTMDSLGNYPEVSQNGGFMLANYARLFASTNPTMASLAQWLCEETYYTSCAQPMSANHTTTERWALWTNFLGYHTGVTAQSAATLGLQKNRCFAYGQCFFRDAWSYDGTSSLVTYYAAPWHYGASNEYSQASTGSFAIHYGGPIVVMPGAGAHSALQESGWDGNTITLVRPSETRGAIVRWDKGGARPLGNFGTVDSTADLTENSQWDLGGLKTTACGGAGAKCARIDISENMTTHAYQYLYTDLCRAYNGSQNIDSENTSKCTNYERQLVDFHPPTPGTNSGFVVIRDRLTTPDTGVEPRWQLWPAAHATVTTKTMTISGGTACVPASEVCTTRNSKETVHWTGTCDGSITGAIAYTGNAGLAAKGWWTPLEPASCKIVERGGPNASNVAYQSDSFEWEDPYGVQGANYVGMGSISGSGGAHLAAFTGSWRYELLYQTTATDSPFLNVIEYAVSGASAKATVVKLTGTNTIGARIDAPDARCAIFKTTTGTLTTGDFELATVDTFDCLITELAASTAVTFTKGSNITSVTNIVDSDTDLTYTSTAQGTVWLRIVVGGAGTGANNRVSW